MQTSTRSVEDGMIFQKIAAIQDSFVDWFIRIKPWKQRGVLFLAGAILSLGLPPLNLWPVIFVGFPVLLLALEGSPSWKKAFGTGWWFSFGYFTTSLYWISNALLVFSNDFWWMVPFALIGLPIVLSVYGGLASFLTFKVTQGKPQNRLVRVLVLAGLLGAFDIARGYLFTGFPWNSYGYLVSGSNELSQFASVVGVYGLGLIVCLSGLLMSLNPKTKLGKVGLAGSLLIPVFLLVFGFFRLQDAPEVSSYEQDDTLTGIRLVQSNIPQREKWDRELRLRNFSYHLEDSLRDRPDWVSLVIWPETAAAFVIEEREDLRRQASQYAIPDGGYLITGAPRILRDIPQLHNSAVVLGQNGDVFATYDKSHLVPFGEYVPLSWLLPIAKITSGALDYSPGPGPQTLRIDGIPPFSPLICYEVIFPAAVTDGEDRPDWLLNVTNDAWYGESAGPYQHIQHSRLRAVEEGLPLVRPANTGVSIAFDGYGREMGRIPLVERGVLDFHLPPPLEPTFFSKMGNIIALVMCLFIVIAGLFLQHRSFSTNR